MLARLIFMSQEIQIDTTKTRGAIVFNPHSRSYYIFAIIPGTDAIVRHEMPDLYLPEVESMFYVFYPDGYLVPQWILDV